jgi:hypothetical protein
MPWDCIDCVLNAYVDEFGWCQCDSYWSGSAQCDTYSGPCDPRCDGCYDVGVNQCISCSYHATYIDSPYASASYNPSSDEPNFIDDSAKAMSGYCECEEDYGGDDCTFYTGKCHDMCYGCFGPEQYQCIFCREGAYMDNEDADATDRNACICVEGRTGPLCEHT